MARTTIRSEDITDATIQSLKNRNLIINGAMNVAQRGTSSTTNGYGTVDRFYANYAYVGITQSQETLTSGDPYDLGFRKFFRLTNTSVSAATNAYSQFFQIIEAQNVACSGWNYLSSSSYVTLSFWVRSSLAGTYQGHIKSLDGTNKNNSFEFTLSANTWTKVTKTFSGDSSIQIDNDNGPGLALLFVADYGTDYTTSGHTHDVWQTYDNADQIKDFAQSWNNTAGATFDLTGVQLEAGSVNTPFEHESYGETLAKCQRYYVTSGNVGSNLALGKTFFFYAHHANEGGASNYWPVPMRAAPTVTFSDNAGTTSSVHRAGIGDVGGGVTAIWVTDYAWQGVLKTSGWAVGNNLIASYAADAEL